MSLSLKEHSAFCEMALGESGRTNTLGRLTVTELADPLPPAPHGSLLLHFEMQHPCYSKV